MEAIEKEPRTALGLNLGLVGEDRRGDDRVPVLADRGRPDEGWNWEKRQSVLYQVLTQGAEVCHFQGRAFTEGDDSPLCLS